MNLDPKRLKNENFDDYKKRRLIINKLFKIYLKGKPINYTKKELIKLGD